MEPWSSSPILHPTRTRVLPEVPANDQGRQLVRNLQGKQSKPSAQGAASAGDNESEGGRRMEEDGGLMTEDGRRMIEI